MKQRNVKMKKQVKRAKFTARKSSMQWSQDPKGKKWAKLPPTYCP